jgi:hypothetical protein
VGDWGLQDEGKALLAWGQIKARKTGKASFQARESSLNLLKTPKLK